MDALVDIFNWYVAVILNIFGGYELLDTQLSLPVLLSLSLPAFM